MEFSRAANGIIGLETALPLSLKLVDDKILTMEALIEKMVTLPARILGLTAGLSPGNPADLTIVDPDTEYTVDADKFNSKSRNTPFAGWKLKGCPVVTIVSGKTVFQADG